MSQYHRMMVTADGRVPHVSPAFPEPSDQHRQWLAQLLTESPANLQGLVVQQISGTNLSMEWQAVFLGAGVAYFQQGDQTVAACLLFQGRHLISEIAAIDALQQTLQAKKAAGFELVRRAHARPMRAIILLRHPLDSEVIGSIAYWADCLAQAYLGTLPTAPSETHSADGVSIRAV